MKSKGIHVFLSLSPLRGVPSQVLSDHFGNKKIHIFVWRTLEDYSTCENQEKHGRRPKDLLALRTGLMHLLWKMGNNHLNYYLRPTSKCRSSKHVSNLKGQSYINNPINLPSVEEDHQMLQSRQLYVVNYFGVRWLSKHFFKVQFKRPYHVNPPWMRALHCTPWSVIITLAGRYYSVNWYLQIFHDKTILQRWILDFSTVNMRPGL